MVWLMLLLGTRLSGAGKDVHEKTGFWEDSDAQPSGFMCMNSVQAKMCDSGRD